MGPVAHNQWDRIDTIMYMLIYPHRPLVETRTIDHIGCEPYPSPNPNHNPKPNPTPTPTLTPTPTPSLTPTLTVTLTLTLTR